MADVIVAGRGPTGLMLAGELALAGVDVSIVERRPTPELLGSRAGGFHSRTIEIFDQRGIADRFLAEGQIVADGEIRHDGAGHQRLSDPASVWARAVAEPHGADPRGLDRGARRAGPSRARGHRLRAGRDRRRRRSSPRAGRAGEVPRRRRWRAQRDPQGRGIDFPGWDATRSNLIAEVEVTEEPPPGMRQDEAGCTAWPHGGRAHLTGRHDGAAARARPPSPPWPTSATALRAVFGTDFGVHSPTWISRFTDATRQAAAYRNGRVLLAGDAAHIHYPAGGQGIGLGIQDAVNLGWKLAQVVKGVSPDAPGHLPRRAASGRRRALELSMAQTSACSAPTPRIGAVATDRRADGDGRASPAPRGAHPRSRHRLRLRRGAPAARPPHAGSGPRHG